MAQARERPGRVRPLGIVVLTLIHVLDAAPGVLALAGFSALEPSFGRAARGRSPRMRRLMRTSQAGVQGEMRHLARRCLLGTSELRDKDGSGPS